MAFVATSFTACQGSSASTKENERIRPTYDQQGRLKTLEYDSNGDGKIDTWGYMDGTRVLRVEADENGDGKVDHWEYHREPSGTGTAAGAQAEALETLERLEESTHFDGRVDRRTYYEHGQMTRREEDTDGDGAIDKWETYSAAGALTMMALDTLHRGRPDRRLLYKPDGSLDRIETDPSGTGNFQTISQ